MSSMTMKVEFLAGTDISTAVWEAIVKANTFDLAYVVFDFNGISMSIGKKATIDNGVKAFRQAMEGQTKYAVVNS